MGLSEAERAELAHFLIQSLDAGPDETVEAAWDEELSRRLAEIEAGTAIGHPAGEVMAELRAKYS